jgi:septum formation inhibitor-activating ATPase MinD
MSKDWNSDFEKIVSSMSMSESDSKDILSDEQLQRMVDQFDRNNELVLIKETANIKYINMLSVFHSANTLAVLTGIVLAVAWSFYFWFK